MEFVQLQELLVLQQDCLSALRAIASGGLRPPDAAYDRYLGLARDLLQRMTAVEAASPGTFELQPLALAMVQQLSIYADHRDNDGDSIGAATLRREAEDLTVVYLDEVATAGVRRSGAARAAAEGRFQDALIGLQDACDVFVRHDVVLEAVKTELSLANVFEWLGDHQRALETLRAAHEQVQPLLAAGIPSSQHVSAAITRELATISQGRASTEGQDLLSLRSIAYEVIQAEARNNRALGDHDAAERLFRQARPFLAEMGLTVGIDYHLAVMACARQDLVAAQELIDEIAPAFDTPMVRPRKGALRQLQSDLALLRGNPDQALQAAGDGLADQLTYPDLDLAWKLHWRSGRALAAAGRHDEAIESYRQAMSDADRLRMAPLGYRLDTTFVRDKLPMAVEAIDLALERADADAVAWFIELVKSRSLSATLSMPRSVMANSSTDESLFDEISRRVDALAFAMYSKTAPPGALTERQDLLTDRDTLLERIRIREPRWRAMTEPAPVDIDQIRTRLGDRTALVLFHRGSRVVSVVIDRHGAVAGVQQLTPATEQAITRFAKNLTKPVPDDYLFDLSGEEKVGLEDLLPSNVIDRCTNAETLIVIPHGILHLLPWACLTVGSERLFQRTAVGALPNLAALPLIDAEPIVEPSIALIGAPDYTGLDKAYGPLSESLPEIADVRAVYEPRVVASTRVGSDATEEAFWKLARQATGLSAILHFSGHGSLEATEPLYSGLVLTGSTLDAAELMSRPLPFTEVVLSACSTAWRPQATRGLDLVGDDALGLPASFLEAGARFLLASIPKAREKASRAFTVSWHRKRHSGLSPLQAYRQVQLEMYAAEPRQVFAWAGITAYGCR